MKPYKLLASVMCLALVLSACAPVIVPPAGEAVQPAAASAETTAEIELKPHQPRPDAPKYALRGPFGVGVRDMLVQPAKDGDRPLRVNVWYPALIPQGAKEAVTYKMDFLADPAAGFPTGGRALRDAAPNPASGPYPLVLYSHGSWCFREIASLFLEHLASHGFVVMAPLHEDNWGNMYQPTWRSEISRPRDMVRTLDFAEALTASGGAMAGLIDTAHVAVKGHSFGGRIALEMGGARLNVKEWLENYCVAYPKDMRCVGYPEHLEEMAALAGFEALPEGLWPDWSDPRIDVVVATGPSVNMLGGGGLDGLRRPVLLLYGTLDTSAGAAIEYRRLYESLPGRQKTRVLFEGAGHMIFGNACPAYPGMVKAGYHMFCSDPVWDVDRAHDLTNHFVTAFLLAELKGDAGAVKALAPVNVSFPGIRYETTAYGAAAKEAAAPPKPRGLRPDAPTYGVRGPYPVGVRNFAIAAGAEKQRPLNVTIWYPALNPKGLPEEYTYEMRFAPGQFPLWKIFGHAIRNADPATTDGPYPLVVYSHAHWSFAQEFPHLLEHLASRGFVVISADHEDNWSTAFGPKAWQTEFQRPQEVTREINYAESLSAAGGVLEGLIDAKRVAVAGWSYGGQTALMSVGARLDLVGLRAWCEKNTVGEQPPVRDCVELLPYEKELAAFSGLNQVPKGLWPDWGDARVDAAIAMAPPAVFGATGLQTVKAPVMFMAASDDAMVGPLYKASDPYKQVAVEQKIEIVFDRASHLLFTGSCENEPDLVAMGFHSFCAEPVWDKSRAHDLINHFVTAFLLAELKGDAEAAKALAAEKVSFPGIQYQSAGYGAAAEPKAKLDTDTIAKIEALVAKEMADKDIPGVSLGIVKDSQVAYAKGFGVAERGTDRPMTPQTQFAVACITKGFTTAAIMQLVEQGLVKLDAPVTDYLPYFKLADERYREITIHHLLANTAGLPMPDYVKLYGGFSQNPSWSPDLLEKYVRSLADKPMTKDPTENTFVYGGDYFDILGDVIAKASGQPFEEYMEEHILRPLGLEHTTFIVDDLDPKLAAAAHWQDANGEMQVSVPSPTYYPAHTPSNGMFSTTEDLLKWAIFNLNRGKLDGRQIVAASAYEEMWKPQVKIPWGGIIQHWGYGWGISDVEGHRLVFWGGGHIGSGNAYYLVPEEKLALHVAVNRSLKAAKGNEYADAIAFSVLKMLLAGEKKAPASALPEDHVAKIEALVEKKIADGQVPGAAVGVVKGGELVYAKGFGMAELGGKTPVTPDSIFHMASVSKSVVGMAIMQLVAAGKVELDAPVTKYLPYFAVADPAGKEITIRQLLIHTSGLREIPDWIPEWSKEKVRTDDGALEAYVRSLTSEKLLFPPGKDWSYSSIAFDVLGDVIAKASGQSFEAYVQKHILAPLGMKHSTFLMSDVNQATLMRPHMVDAKGKLETIGFFPYNRIHAPGATLFTSVKDMARLAIANMNRGELDGVRVLPAAAYDQMWAPQVTSKWAAMFGPLVTSNGLGWWVGEFGGHPAIGHYGAVTGYQSHLTVFPKDNIAVVVFVNVYDPEDFKFRAMEIGNGMAEVLLGIKPKPAA